MSPCSEMRVRWRSSCTSGIGLAESSAWVYGWAGSRKMLLMSPSSTIRPRYITATWSAMCSTTARSCDTNRYVRLSCFCSPMMRLRICACTDTSSADTGSSRMRTLGSKASAGDADTLALTTGELVGVAVRHLGVEPNELHQLAHPLLRLPGAHAEVDSERFGDGAVDRHAWVERPVWVLEHDLQLLANPLQLGLRERQDVLLLAVVAGPKEHLARRRFDEPQDRLDQRGLAAARFADEAQRRTLRDVEGDALEHLGARALAEPHRAPHVGVVHIADRQRTGDRCRLTTWSESPPGCYNSIARHGNAAHTPDSMRTREGVLG